MRFHDLSHGLLGDLCQKLKTVVGLVQCMCECVHVGGGERARGSMYMYTVHVCIVC